MILGSLAPRAGRVHTGSVLRAVALVAYLVFVGIVIAVCAATHVAGIAFYGAIMVGVIPAIGVVVLVDWRKILH